MVPIVAKNNPANRLGLASVYAIICSGRWLVLIDHIQDFVLLFSAILWEALPFIVLGALVAGLLEEFLPQSLITRIMPSSAVPAVIVGGLLGLVFPMCECGIVVVMRRLLKKGLPLACCVAYMLAGPIVNAIVLTSTYVAFKGHGIGPQMVLYRAGFGFVIAALTGLIVYRLEKKHGLRTLLTPTAAPPTAGLEMADIEAPKRKSAFDRAGNVAGTALHDFMDITVFLILGAILAATVKFWLVTGSLESMSQNMPYLSIPLMMLMAVLMCLCSEADAFVAASFTKMAMSSKLSFLVLGPMLDLKLLLMYTRVFKLKLIIAIASSTCILTFVSITAFHLLAQQFPRFITW